MAVERGGLGFKMADAYVEIHTDNKAVVDSIRRMPTVAGRDADKAGADIGSKLTQGIQMSIVRNSPMIAAGVGAALTLGAPAAAAGATALFGGIGAIAVAQNEKVQVAWRRLGQQIKDGAVADAAVLVPTYTRMADQVGSAFDRLRPQLREAFEESAPNMERLTSGVIKFSENAMPGMVRSVASADPVFRGLESLLGDMGTGVSGFFDGITRGGPGSQQVLESIGDITQELLPTVGELLGVFAQFAGAALPVLTTALGGTTRVLTFLLDVLEPIAPVLGEITGSVLTAYAAWRLFGTVGGVAQGIATSLGSMATRAKELGGTMAVTNVEIDRSEASTGRWSTALGKVGNSLPIVGALLTAAAMGYEEFGSTAEANARRAADGSISLRQALEAERAQVEKNLLFEARSGQLHDMTAAAAAEVTAEYKRMYDALPPLQQAQVDVTNATDAYTLAVREHTANSPEARAAAAELAAATDRVELQTQQASDATKSYSDRLIELTDLMSGVIGGQIGYESSQLRVESAANRAREATRQYKDGSLQAREATNSLEQAVNGQAEAARKQAEANSRSTDKTLRAKEGTDAYRRELLLLAQNSDTTVAGAARRLLSNLSNTELRALEADTAVGGLGGEVIRLPGGKTINISTPGLAAAREGIRGLQTEIRNINGKDVSIFVSATGKGGIASAGRLAGGGPVSGPGTGTSDEAGLFALSHGEHVWTAREVDAAGGHGAMQIMRKEVIRRGRGLAEGGPADIRLNTRYKYTGPSPASIFGGLGQSFMSAAVPSGGGGGAARWSGVVLQALSMMGQPSSLLGTVLRRMNQESGGNPNAINNWDINAKRGTPSIGLMQTIGPTFAAYHDPRTSWNIRDPLANILASMRYAMARYGSLARAYNRAGGYDDGGLATGAGYLPKATLQPERVLSPRQTEAFEAALSNNFGMSPLSSPSGFGAVASGASSGASTVVIQHLTLDASGMRDIAQLVELVNSIQQTARRGPVSIAGVRG